MDSINLSGFNRNSRKRVLSEFSLPVGSVSRVAEIRLSRVDVPMRLESERL